MLTHPMTTVSEVISRPQYFGLQSGPPLSSDAVTIRRSGSLDPRILKGKDSGPAQKVNDDSDKENRSE
jgi:hypothetical protein